MKTVTKGVATAVGAVGALTAVFVLNHPAGAQVAPQCNAAQLKGVYSFNAVGLAPVPPLVVQTLFNPIVKTANGETAAFPLLAIGEVLFDGAGHSKGFTQENLGGINEPNIPFTGTYTLAPGPGGIGCTGDWTLQDQHTLAPFNTEPPHFFKITLFRENKGFHFITFGGGPGPVSLSGEALLDYK